MEPQPIGEYESKWWSIWPYLVEVRCKGDPGTGSPGWSIFGTADGGGGLQHELLALDSGRLQIGASTDESCLPVTIVARHVTRDFANTDSNGDELFEELGEVTITIAYGECDSPP